MSISGALIGDYFQTPEVIIKIEVELELRLLKYLDWVHKIENSLL